MKHLNTVLNTLLAASLLSATTLASASTVIDFESATPGAYNNLMIGDVTFSTTGNEMLYINNDYAGQFNTENQSLQNTYSSDAFNTLNISFSNVVNNFGFNFGASDEIWTLSAFDVSNNLLSSIDIPVLGFSNAGDFFSLSSSGIASATLSTTSTGDYIFVDNFTVSAVPEPSTYALMLGGLGLVGFMAARRRKQA
jgi:hypothetical protein